MKTAEQIHADITATGIELPLHTVSMIRSVVFADLHKSLIDNEEFALAKRLLNAWFTKKEQQESITETA